MPYVLLVEDDASIAHILQYYFETLQITCCKANTLSGVKSCIESAGLPTIVLLDYVLNGQNADDIVEFLKEAGVPNVVLMTAASRPKDIQVRCGLTRLLAKPFTIDDLDVILAGLVHSR